MPDGLYDRDILSWSEHQAALLRRLAAGERVNDELDWENLIDEVESVGRSELFACESLLRQALVHLLKIHFSPESLAVGHWRSEIVGFLADARRRYSPSMKQRIDLDDLFSISLRQVAGDGPTPASAATKSAGNPFQLNDLLSRDLDVPALLARLRSPAPRAP